MSFGATAEYYRSGQPRFPSPVGRVSSESQFFLRGASRSEALSHDIWLLRIWRPESVGNPLAYARGSETGAPSLGILPSVPDSIRDQIAVRVSPASPASGAEAFLTGTLCPRGPESQASSHRFDGSVQARLTSLAHLATAPVAANCQADASRAHHPTNRRAENPKLASPPTQLPFDSWSQRDAQ